MSTIALESYDESGQQFLIYDWQAPEWGSVYGENGSGYTFFRFKLLRPSGHVYPDIGFGFDFRCRKYLKTILFNGQIRLIEEVAKPDGDEIIVTALGDIIVTEDEELLRAFCDTRLNRWETPSELPSTDFQPNKFSATGNALGIVIHPGHNSEIANGEFTEVVHEFYPDEVAERFRGHLSMVLGNGVIFNATIDYVDQVWNAVYYINPSAGESTVKTGMILINITKDKSATISTVDAGLNRIVCSTSVAGWEKNDEIYVAGPEFWGVIASISGLVITYTDDIGEGNLLTGRFLANLTKKTVALISAYDTGANTITVSDAYSIDGWAERDVLMLTGTSLWNAWIDTGGPTNDGDGTATIPYTSDKGTLIVRDSIGWYLYNLWRDEWATVDGWDVANGKVMVNSWSDVSTWSAGEGMSIFAPFKVEVLDSADNVLWPEATDDPRISSASWFWWPIDVLTTGSPTSFKIRGTVYISAKFTEGTFASFTNVRTYSTESETTPEFLAKETISLLSVAGHGLSSSINDVADIKPFEALVNTADDLTKQVVYKSDTGEENLNVGDGLFNVTRSERVTITAVDTATNTITVMFFDDLSTWASDDVLETRVLLEPMFFEFMSPREALTWACGFGNGKGGRLAWGIRLDDRRRLFLEEQDLATVRYVVRRSEGADITHLSGVQESVQYTRAVYADTSGKQQYTSWQFDTSAYFNSKYRRKSVRLDSVSRSDRADVLVAQWLLENKYPKDSTTYRVYDGTVETIYGVKVPIDELVANGGLIRISGMRSMEDGRTVADLRNSFTTELMAGVQVNLEGGYAEVYPAAPRSTFQMMMARIARANLR